MKKLALLILIVIMLSACVSSGPVLGPPTLLQQALNSLPAVSVAGQSLQFQFGGETWVSKFNGNNFSGGIVKQIETDRGSLLVLKQTHMSPSAIPGAAAVPGINWIAMAGPDIVFEYNAGPPMAIKLLSKEEAAERLGADFMADDGAGGSVGAVAGLAAAPGAFSGELPDNLLKLDDAVKRAARGVEQALPQGTTIAVFNVASPSQAFSEYVIEELTGELVNGRKVAFVDRRNREFAVREMNIQASGNLADERMQGLGRLLGARSVVSGTLTSMGGYYRLRFRVMNVETQAIQTQVSLDLQNDSQVAHLLGSSPTRVTTASTTTASGAASTSGATPASMAKKAPVESGTVFAGNGHRYELINKGKSWINARKDCEKRGGYLATITSAEEQQFIEDLISMNTEKKYNCFWLGGYQGKGFKWVTGEPFEYTNWLPGKPMSGSDRIRLMIVTTPPSGVLPWNAPSGQWDNVHNNEHNSKYWGFMGYICEWGDVTEAIPSP